MPCWCVYVKLGLMRWTGGYRHMLPVSPSGPPDAAALRHEAVPSCAFDRAASHLQSEIRWCGWRCPIEFAPTRRAGGPLQPHQSDPRPSVPTQLRRARVTTPLPSASTLPAINPGQAGCRNPSRWSRMATVWAHVSPRRTKPCPCTGLPQPRTQTALPFPNHHSGKAEPPHAVTALIQDPEYELYDF